MLTHSSVWIFNKMRYNGLYKRIYDLHLHIGTRTPCIGIRTPVSLSDRSMKIIFNKSWDFPRSRKFTKKIPDFWDCNLGPGLEALAASCANEILRKKSLRRLFVRVTYQVHHAHF